MAPVELSHAPEWLLTGSLEISVFQTLSLGSTWHDVPGGDAWTDVGAMGPNPAEARIATTHAGAVRRLSACTPV